MRNLCHLTILSPYQLQLVTQFLVELDACSEGVIVVGTTTAPSLIDSALLRPGRLEQVRGQRQLNSSLNNPLLTADPSACAQ